MHLDKRESRQLSRKLIVGYNYIHIIYHITIFVIVVSGYLLMLPLEVSYLFCLVSAMLLGHSLYYNSVDVRRLTDFGCQHAYPASNCASDRVPSWSHRVWQCRRDTWRWMIAITCQSCLRKGDMECWRRDANWILTFQNGSIPVGSDVRKALRTMHSSRMMKTMDRHIETSMTPNRGLTLISS